MYGLILENMAEFIRQVYGEDRWEDIRRQAGVEQPSFSVHQVFPENLIPRLAKKAQQVLGVSEREFMDQMGVHFVGFVSQYGYDRVLSVLGRHMRDFLNGLDNLHEYLKFSYPRMRAPSFICENESRQGLTLHYRSKRRGFVYYTMGQIREVARHFYHKEMHIELVREELLFDTTHVTFQLTFDNRAFTLASLAMTREEKHLPISASVLFEIFPFCIVFGSDMIVRSIGNSLMVILPDLLGKKITKWFDLVRPLIAFKFQTILNRTNNIFELVTVDAVLTEGPNTRNKIQSLVLSDEMDASQEKNLRLKGQMIYMDNWRMMMYLGTPVMPDLTSLITTGLYINDLSMHDFSRDLMLAGTQQSVELKLALDQEQQKSKKLEESMRKLDEEMRRTDELLYQMIPKQVADRLRTGENPIDTCEMFDSVSILFSDVVTFTEICSRITPMEVVSMLNAMYSIFDTLTERNRVYKVETIGDAYMVVSGAPEKEINHAEMVCDMALDMVEAITDLKDPSTGSHLQIRVGVHSGAVVAGIVGLKMPRYCLFGDSVNTASRMESTSEAMKIHISQSTREQLSPSYFAEERGEISVKGKGAMKTYWLTRRENRTPVSKILSSTAKQAWTAESVPTSATSHGPPGEPGSALAGIEERRVYSPVTFQEVARRSVASSPIKIGTRESRSNSMGTMYAYSPAEVFGSLVSETDEFLDLHSQSTPERQFSGVGGTVYRLTTAPARTDIQMRHTLDLEEELMSGNVRKIPSYSAPAVINSFKKTELHIPSMEITHTESRSNSMGTMYAYSPAEVFGSLVSETDEFLDLHSQSTPERQFSGVGGTVYRLTTAPARTDIQMRHTLDLEEELMSGNVRKIPSYSAPAVINSFKKTELHIPSMEITHTDDDFPMGMMCPLSSLALATMPTSSRSDSNLVSHTNSKGNSKTPTSSACKNRNNKNLSSKQRKNNLTNKDSENQCCGSFGNPHSKHKMSSNSCTMS